MEEIAEYMKKGTKLYLQLYIKTWNNDSDGIFNYKEENKCRHVLDETDENGFYGRNQNNIIIKKKSQTLFDNNEIILLRIRKSLKVENKYEIINPISKQMKKNKINIDQLNNAAWYIIRPESSETDYCENENEKYVLHENDILKFGPKKYEVVKININNTNNNSNEDNLAYNISQINKGKGSIFNINIEPYQYKVTENNTECNKEISNNEKEKNNNLNKKFDTDKIKEKFNNKNENDNKKLNNDSNDNNDNNNNEIINISENQSNINSTKESNNSMDKQIKNDNNDNINFINKIYENEKCRICYSFESTKDNPLLRICSCTDFIHFKCLKENIKTQIERHKNSDSTVETHVYPKFNCEVCLAPYPIRFRIKECNKIYELIDYNVDPKLGYIVLESLDYIIDDKNYKIIHVVKLIKDKISFGINFFNDIYDKNISDSREHAILKYNKEKGNISIMNKSDTFSTLVLIKGNITVKEKKISFQVANNYITASMIEKNIGENVTMKHENNYNSTNSSTCKTIDLGVEIK